MPRIIIYILLYIFAKNLQVLAENADEFTDGKDGDIMGVAPSIIQRDAGFESPNLLKGQWPKNIIPYQFHEDYPRYLRRLFHRAARHISHRTCIRFVPRTNQPDYIQVISGKGCSSYVGRIGGGQNVSIPRTCTKKGIFVHELLHAIGLRHEQSRGDRDKFVKVHYENIKEGHQHNFERYQVDLRVPYDYGSVMHYDRTAFTKNGKDTITPIKPGKYIGQRAGMSKADIKEVNELFCKRKN